ncbi:hypothetical protein, partial [Bifidobacterium catenulatum]|uniref:hypothetical protein n=1 Tax=Bifidobacterium catenulatum TaxID=1686 RepID=UPI0034A30F22
QPRGSELTIAPWTATIQSAQLFGHYPQIFLKFEKAKIMKNVFCRETVRQHVSLFAGWTGNPWLG